MQSHPQDRIDSKPEPSPMAIVGAILAQGAIRILRREDCCFSDLPFAAVVRLVVVRGQVKGRPSNVLTLSI
jgi:hypothetical protein